MPGERGRYAKPNLARLWKIPRFVETCTRAELRSWRSILSMESSCRQSRRWKLAWRRLVNAISIAMGSSRTCACLRNRVKFHVQVKFCFIRYSRFECCSKVKLLRCICFACTMHRVFTNYVNTWCIDVFNEHIQRNHSSLKFFQNFKVSKNQLIYS